LDVKVIVWSWNYHKNNFQGRLSHERTINYEIILLNDCQRAKIGQTSRLISSLLLWFENNIKRILGFHCLMEILATKGWLGTEESLDSTNWLNFRNCSLATWYIRNYQKVDLKESLNCFCSLVTFHLVTPQYIIHLGRTGLYSHKILRCKIKKICLHVLQDIF
jgi:hypothetical protein